VNGRRGLGLFAVLALCSIPASAQNIAGSWEITGVGGGYFGRQIYQGGLTTVDVGTTVEYGARLGYNLTDGIEVEASWTRAKPDLDATPTGSVGLPIRIGTLTSDAYELDWLFSVGSRSASFYIVLGAGATTQSPQILTADALSSTHFSASAGMGGKFWLGRNFGLRVEGRWRWIVTGATTNAGIWCDPFVCYAYSTSVYGYPDLTGGVTLRF
jgi:hypothetical protein